MLKLNAVSWNDSASFLQRPHGKLGAKLNCQNGMRCVVRFVSTIMSEAGYAQNDVQYVCAVCEEALGQALQVGHEASSAREVEFSCHVDSRGVRVVIQDLGPGDSVSKFTSRNSLGAIDWVAIDQKAHRITFGKRPSLPLNPAGTIISTQ